MMQIPEFLHKLEAMLELPPGRLTLDTPLASIPEWDSLASVGFMALGMEAYDTMIDPDRLAAARHIADLVAMLPAQGGQHG